MVDNEITMIQLNKENMQRYLSDLLELEHLVYIKRGHLYSTEEWGETHFLADLPGKFELSCGVVQDDKLTAFLIGSESLPGICHVHRVAVHPKHPGHNTGRKLMYKAFSGWRNMPQYHTITAIIREDHKLSVPFVKMLGAQIADKSYMVRHFEKLGKTGPRIFDNHFEDEYGIRYVFIYITR